MSDTPESLEAAQQRAKYALTRKHERELKIASIQYPKRRTLEMRKLGKVIDAMHELLVVQDEAEVPSETLDHTSDMFAAYLDELAILCTPSPAK